MRPSILGLLAFLAVCGTESQALAAAGKVDPLADPSAAYQALRKTLQEFTEPPSACTIASDVDPASPYRCHRAGPRAEGRFEVLAPPFPIAGKASPFESPPYIRNFGTSCHIATQESWAPLSTVHDGPAQLTRLRELAREAEAGKCQRRGCDVVVEYREGPATLLSQCRAMAVDSIPGAPYDCKPMGIIQGDETWLRITSHVAKFANCGSTANQAMEDTEFDVDLDASDDPLPIQEVMTELEKRFRGGDWALTTEFLPSESHGSLRAVASKRVSPFLTDYRETVGLHVDAAKHRVESVISVAQGGEVRSKTRTHLAVRVSLYLWVTLQNVTDPLAWHEATDVQSRDYMKRIQAEISTSVKAICQGKKRKFSANSSLSWSCE